jgi:hypothetical protein
MFVGSTLLRDTVSERDVGASPVVDRGDILSTRDGENLALICKGDDVGVRVVKVVVPEVPTQTHVAAKLATAHRILSSVLRANSIRDPLLCASCRQGIENLNLERNAVIFGETMYAQLRQLCTAA